MAIFIIAAIIFVWLTVLSWIVVSTRKHYFNLISRTKHKRIDDILDSMLTSDDALKKEVEKVKNEVNLLLEQSKLHLHKIGLIRFNPFERSGGEQSFVLTLLDDKNNGIIINFIYTREGLRVYSKKVKNGQGDEYILSEEEQKAIQKST